MPRLSSWLGLLALTLVGMALGQEATPSGVITGAVDGTTFELRTYAPPSGEESAANTSLRPGSGATVGGTLLGQSAPALWTLTPGGVALVFLILESPCPCRSLSTEITFSPEGGRSERFYRSIDARLVVESLQEIEPGVFRMSGTFAGTLAFKESLLVELDRERTVAIEGSFVIERIAQEEN